MSLYSPLSWSLGRELHRLEPEQRRGLYPHHHSGYPPPYLPTAVTIHAADAPHQRSLCELRMQLGARSRATVVLPSRVLQQSSPDSVSRQRRHGRTDSVITATPIHRRSPGTRNPHCWLFSLTSLGMFNSVRGNNSRREPLCTSKLLRGNKPQVLVKHTCDPSNQETEGGGLLRVQG